MATKKISTAGDQTVMHVLPVMTGFGMAMKMGSTAEVPKDVLPVIQSVLTLALI